MTDALDKLITLFPDFEMIDEHFVGHLNPKFGPATKLPADYIEFMNVIGPGTLEFNGQLVLEILDLVGDYTTKAVLELLDAFRGLHEDFPGDVPAIYPEDCSILPWGHSDQGETYFWRTDSDPDDWPVVINDRVQNPLVGTEHTFSSYLLWCLETEELDEEYPRKFYSAVNRND